MKLNSMCENSWQALVKQCSAYTLLALTLAVIFVLAQPVNSFATAPRTSALGGDNTFFEDDSNVLRWYGSLVDYGNQIMVGSGHHDFAEDVISWSDSKSGFEAGVHVDLDSEGKWGTAGLYFHEQMRDGDVSTSIEDDPGDSFTLMYGRRFGSVQAGISLQHGLREWSVAIDTFMGQPMSARKLERTTVGFGVRADLSASSYLDVAFDLHGVSWQESDLNFAGQKPDSWNNFSFRTRAFFALGKNMAVVPVVEFWSEDYITPFEHYNQTIAHENTMLRMGCGLNFFPNSDNFMLVSASYLGMQDNPTYANERVFDKKLNQFNFMVATETRWNHWLTLRASASCNYFTLEDNYGRGNDFYSTLFPLSFGAGFHLGKADLDIAMASYEPGLINPNWLHIYSDHHSAQASGAWFSASLRYLF